MNIYLVFLQGREAWAHLHYKDLFFIIIILLYQTNEEKKKKITFDTFQWKGWLSTAVKEGDYDLQPLEIEQLAKKISIFGSINELQTEQIQQMKVNTCIADCYLIWQEIKIRKMCLKNVKNSTALDMAPGVLAHL